MNFLTKLFGLPSTSDEYIVAELTKTRKRLLKEIDNPSDGCKIRFIGVEKGKITREIARKTNVFYKGNITEEDVLRCYNDIVFKNSSTFFEYDDIMGLEGSNFGLYEFDKQNSKSIVFVVLNGAEVNNDVEREMIKYWLCKYVLPDYDNMYLSNAGIKKAYYFTPILRALEYFDSTFSSSIFWDATFEVCKSDDVWIDEVTTQYGYSTIVLR